MEYEIGNMSNGVKPIHNSYKFLVKKYLKYELFINFKSCASLLYLVLSAYLHIMKHISKKNKSEHSFYYIERNSLPRIMFYMRTMAYNGARNEIVN